MPTQKFKTTIESGERGRVYIVLPFNPAELWGKKQRHYVKGMLNGAPFQGSLGARDGIYFMPVNKELQQSANVSPGDQVTVTMEADAPKQEDLPVDLAQALNGAPRARSFYDTLSAFYRNQYVKWIEDAKKPETRAARIKETVALLEAGKKQR